MNTTRHNAKELIAEAESRLESVAGKLDDSKKFKLALDVTNTQLLFAIAISLDRIADSLEKQSNTTDDGPVRP